MKMWFLYFYRIFAVLLYILTLPLTVTLFFILSIYKQIVTLLAKLFCKNYVGPIPSSGYLFLTDICSDKPHSSLIIALELDGNCTWNKIVQTTQYAYDLRDEQGRRCYREFGYCPVIYLGHGFWKKVENFNISDGVQLLKNEELVKPANADDQWELLSLVEEVQQKPFQKGSPLWEFYLLQNYKGSPNQSLFILRFHHLMTDGMSIVKYFYALRGSKELPASFPKPANSVQKWNAISSTDFLRKAADLINLCTFGMIDYLHKMFIEKDRNALNYGRNGQLKVTGNWMCSVGRMLDVEKLKRASKQFECSIVHLILVALSDGVEEYMRKYHYLEDEKETMSPLEGFHFQAAIPRPGHPNMRFVNHWCTAKIYARCNGKTTGVAEKVEYFKQEINRCSKDTFPIISAFFLSVFLGVLPCPLLKFASRAQGFCTVNLSNVAGPQDKNLFLADSRILSMRFWLPIPHHLMGLSAGVQSSNGILTVCLTADVGCIPDREKLQDLANMIDDNLDTLCEVTKL